MKTKNRKISNKKLFNIILNSIISVCLIFSVTIGGYYLYNYFNPKVISSTPISWNSYGDNFKKFSQNNSFKAQFVTNETSQNGSVSAEISSGTAWPFYLEKNNNNYDWYLFTNFHVVVDAIKYNTNNNPFETTNNTTYKHNVSITKGFALSDAKPNNGTYNKLFSLNYNYQNSSLLGRGHPIQGVSVISDFSIIHNNNDNLNLFSNSSATLNNFYNLDIAIIKINFNQKSYNDLKIDLFNNVSNPYSNWLDGREITPEYLINKDKYIYIAGNPAKSNNLVPQKILNNNQFINSKPAWKHLYLSSDSILNNLYSKNYYSKESINNWPLTSGASGSAVYHQNINDDNIQTALPIGIYWGGISNNTNNGFKPSFIPFKTERYNIYENFKLFLLPMK